MKITDVCIKNPVFAWMLMAATIVFGGVAIFRIGISQFPDVDSPVISVSVNWEGAAPEVIEKDVVEILEEALMQVEGVKAITTSSRQGNARITVDLNISRDVDLAMQDVQAKVFEAQRRLPRDMDPPTISKSNPEDQPIMWLSISGPFPKQVLSDYARYQMKDKMQTVPGVGEITMGGSVERNIRIWVDAAQLDARGLTVADVTRALQQEHIEMPAGRLESQGREVNVRVLGEAFNLDVLRNIVVREVAGSPIYLKDVALIEDGFEDIRRLGRVNGQPAQGLGIKKQRGANAVALAQDIHKALDEIRASLPEGMEVGINYDTTQFIEDSVHEIEMELILSVLLTAFVCWIFLGSMSSTVNVVLAIPMSLMGTIAVIYFLGFTLNTFTLLALALAVGIVVDDAIMVLENIYRHGEEGKDRVTASREGTQQIAFAALAATLAVVAIFLPVVFMDGVVGRFFLQFGITLSVAVLLSYVEAITLVPALAAQFLNTSREGRNRLGQWADHLFKRLAALYYEALSWGLARPGKVLVAAGILFVVSVFGMYHLPSEFVPTQDQSRLSVRYQTAVGSDLKETDQLIQQAEEFLMSLPEIERIYAIVGGFTGESNGAFMYLKLVEPDKREMNHIEFSAFLRKNLNAIPGLKVVVQDPSQSGFSNRRGFPVEFSVRGPDWENLVNASQEVTQKMTSSGLVVDLDTDYKLGMPELHILPDRARAADLGVSIEDVATTINAMVGGVRVGKYNSGGRRIDVRLRLLANQRARPEDISQLRVRTASGALVPLSALVKTVERPVLQAITRRDRERAISMFANVAPGHAQDEALALVEQLGKEMPLGTRLVLEGASVEFRDSMGNLVFALILGIIVAYMVLASQFNSFLHPVTVLTILPLSVVGALIALFLADKSLNIFSMIGLLLLMGIVKKNSIILVDYANQLREVEGLDAYSAMMKAGPIRLRPILMTAAATLMAALPPALGLGPGAEIRTPMAMAVIGGLIVSTALSLLVVPAFYTITDGFRMRIFGKAGRTQEVEVQAQASD